MREDNLKIEPFEILHLHELKAHQEVNEHGTVTLKGTIHEDKEQEYLALAFKASPMKIFITNHEGLHEIWFDGVITGVEIESDDHFKVITVEAKTGTCLMDVSLHTRTWQEPSLTYSDILSTYTPAYPSGAFIMKEADKSIPGFTMQYRETDWEFSKRMASHFETVLTADFKAGGAKYYFGVPNNSNSSIETL
ncbi:MAG: phage late control D family protein, partial [Defluviitaleaceae bacterium]|nr:phage late control D family protein [Defluviitaleaceae bacterium]